MTPRKFDRYMVSVGAGRHLKFRRLSIPERYAFFMGILSIAAQAPIRGCLLIGSLPADADDLAEEAGVTKRVAQETLRKLREVGVILPDPDHGCERVHDFGDWNPAPKSDPTAAERQRRHRESIAAANGHASVTPLSHRDTTDVSRDVTLHVTPPEVEGEVEVTPLPPRGNRDRDRLVFEDQVKAYTLKLGVDHQDGWHNVRAAIVDGASTDEAVLTWLRKWRPDVLEAGEAA